MEQQQELPGGDEKKVVSFDRGTPVTLHDLFAASQPRASVEYTRCPAFKKDQVFVLQSLTAGDMIEWSEANSGEAKRTAGLRLIVKSVVDGEPGVDEGAKGVLLMDDTHIALLRKLPHKATEGVVRKIIVFNGMNLKLDGDAKND